MERDTQKKHSLESYGFMLSLVVLLFMNIGCAKKIIKVPVNQLQSVLNEKISGQMISENSLLYNDNLSGRIAWNEQYFMESLINMYEVTRDKRYIEIFVRHADHVLSIRDDSAYRWDFMGRMRPGWQTGGYYTLGIPKMIPDIEGLPSLEIQAIHRAGNSNTSVEMTNDGNNEFTLIIRNNFRKKAPVVKKFEHLNMSTVEEHINSFLSPEDWIRVKKSGLNSPTPGIYPLKETYRMVLHELHTPLIGIPFLRFAALVFEEKKLQGYKEKAMAYVTAFEESYRDYKNSWREDRDGGYFVFEPGGRFWASGLPVPYNGLSANGRFLLWLYRVTGKPEYLEKSTKLAKKIRAGINLLSDGTLDMPYWYGLPYDGWKNKKTNPVNGIYVTSEAYNGVEDVSHFTLTLLFMIDAYKMGIVFDDDVIIAASNTFLKKIWMPGGRKEEIKWERDVYNTFLERVEKPKTGFTKMDWKNYSYLAHNLAGRGNAYDYTAGVFAGLGQWSKEIKDNALKVYCSRFLDPEQIDMDYEYGPVLLGWSMLASKRENEISPVPLYPFTPRCSAKRYIKSNNRYHLDEDGILYVDYGRAYGAAGKRYNPGFIAVYAQALCRDYMSTNDLCYKTSFFKQIEWLMKNHVPRRCNGIPFWVWEYDFDNAKFGAKAPWVSAYTNGKIIPVFLKAYELSRDLKYLRAAEFSLRAFIIPAHAGGLATFEKNIAWYEEVAEEKAPSSKILNGHISALAGLWTFWKWSGRKDIKKTLDLGVSAVKRDLKLYDSEFLSYYSQYPKDPPVFAPAHGYNTLHVHQLLWLYSITNDPVFLSYALKFARYDDPGFEISVAGSTDPKGHGPEKLNMGMGNKYWSNNKFPTWVQIDLGGIQEVYGINILGYIAKASPKDYNILSSVNGEEWKLLLEKRGNTKQYAPERFQPEKTRFLRIIIMSDNGNNNVALTGIGIYRKHGNPTAVSNWENFSSGNRPALIFNSGWKIPQGGGWLITDLVKRDMESVIIEINGQPVPEITFFGSDNLEEFVSLKFHRLNVNNDKIHFAINTAHFRYMRINIGKGVKGGILRLTQSQ